MASAAQQLVSKSPIMQTVRRWAYYKSGFAQYGLWRDDCMQMSPVVEEAVRRLPPTIYDQRQFRISRALLLSCKKIELPKDEWTKMEDDVHYLLPLVEEVKAELAEKKEWDAKA